MIPRASSGSRSCSRAVEPLMSANKAVTIFRSPWTLSSAGVCATRISRVTDVFFGAEAIDASMGEPHSSQNLALDLFLEPHFGHESSMGAAHSLQNFAPSRFSAPHFAQFISSAQLGSFETLWILCALR